LRAVRLALVSDMHGNDVAFEAVARDLERLEPDVVVSLGDVAQGGAEPARALERLRALGARTVLGNSDAFLLEVPSDSSEPVTERQLEVRDWTLGQLDRDDLSYLRSFEPTLALELDDHRVFCFHGSPASYDDVLLPDWERATLTPFEGHEADLLAGGHTHTQWTRRIDDALYVNPGSVGLAYDRHRAEEDLRLAPVAEYALVFVDDLGLAVEFRRVPYPLAALRDAILGSGRPYAEEFAAEWEALP
jgi:putative phosphoesterase